MGSDEIKPTIQTKSGLKNYCFMEIGGSGRA